MRKTLKNWLSKALITTLVLSSILTSTTAYATTPNGITSAFATPQTINPDRSDTMEINYCLDATATVSLGIYKESDDSFADSYLIELLTDNAYQTAGCYTEYWDGEYGAHSEKGVYGSNVESGRYFYSLYADSAASNAQTEYSADWIYVDYDYYRDVDGNDSDSDDDSDNSDDSDGSDDTDDDNTQIEILDLEIANATFSPWDGEEAEITFVINKDAQITLEILNEEGEDLETIAYKRSYDAGESTLYWDGRDDFDDIVDEGEYVYKLTAYANGETDKDRGIVKVQKDYGTDIYTEDPRFKHVYMTKDTFDPGRHEVPYLNLTLTSRADLVAAIYDYNGTQIEELINKEDQEAGVYKLEVNMEDYADAEGTYFYKLYAQNISGDELLTGSFEIDKDVKQDKKPNIYRDSIAIDSLPYEPRNNDLDIEFKLESDADVSIEIRDDRKILVEIIDEKEMVAGSHVIGWDGKDSYGDYVYDGVYEYKIIADNMKGKDVEKGNFEVTNTTSASNPVDRCAGYSDVDNNNQYCEAITWAKSAGIMTGYGDETFGPNNALKRVEALKVVVESLGIRTVNGYGTANVFPDVDIYSWYIDYIQTALNLGIVHGYQDGLFRPEQAVTRVEALVMLLQGARAANGLIIPSNSYGMPYYDTQETWYRDFVWMAKEYNLTGNDYYFYPASIMTRAEMADMLYRMHQAGLDD